MGNFKKTKIAILYIALGRYSVFWKDFYVSSEKYFLTNPDFEKTYFVFTDSDTIDFEENKNVVKIEQENLKFPYATMMRFKMFLTQENELEHSDYIFFFNANMEFKAPVGVEILPSPKNDGLVMGMFPPLYDKPNTEWTYERNPKSTSYIPYGVGKYYVQGGINGGCAKEYLELCRYCNNALSKDLEQNIIPIWHDESIINKYILDKNPLIIPCNYYYPEEWNLPEFSSDIKILLRDKTNPKYGGLDWLRGKTDIWGENLARKAMIEKVRMKMKEHK